MTAGGNIGKITAEEMDERGAERLAIAYGEVRMEEYRYRYMTLRKNRSKYTESLYQELMNELKRWENAYIHKSIIACITDTHVLCEQVRATVDERMQKK